MCCSTRPAGSFRRLAELAPEGARRMGANPHANGGLLLRELGCLISGTDAVAVPAPGTVTAKPRASGPAHPRRAPGQRRGPQLSQSSPDETASNRWNAVFEVTEPPLHRGSDRRRRPRGTGRPGDGNVERAPVRRMARRLSAHGHGTASFSCYEAFIHIVDSMFNQHAKWLKVTTPGFPGARPIASLNYLLTSHVWRQDHNGFSHQDPGFIDHVCNKKAEIIRVYLPPDANTLLSVTDHCLRSRDFINVIVAGKQPALQWLDMDAAIKHCTAGIGIWEWASNDAGGEPDVVMACAGDVPHPGNPRGGRTRCVDIFPESEDSRHQCRGLDDAAAAERASPRA